VDEVVGDAGVLRGQGKDAVEDLRRLLLPDVGLVRGRRVAQQGERVEDLGLEVLGVFPRHRLHALLEGEGAGGVIEAPESW
jgi:hypothetical protein